MKLIPIPKSYSEQDGQFTLPETPKVTSAFDLPLITDYTEAVTDGADVEITKDATLPEEGYRLQVTAQGIRIAASAKAGAYYALQSVRRLCSFDTGGREVPCCEIEDAPRYRWRGLQLDESRHFFGAAQVKRLLDMMFAEKLNIFHWHLTDDQGWRVQIDAYPLLTEIGSKRAYTQTGGWDSFQCEDKPHGGYYTKEDIRDIVAYAAERGITVVPEIDFPAHCASAMAAYPELACFPKETEVPGYFGGLIPQWKHGDFRWNRTLCCGKGSTFDFVFAVLDEICALFPSPYFHIGGDEAPLTEWKKCPQCQRVMRENGLQNETELQGWFEKRLIDYLKSKGKTAVGWNEITHAKGLNTAENVAVQYWTRKRDARAEQHINSGGKTVLSNHQAFYFDMPYAMYPLGNTYSYNPCEFGIADPDAVGILGVEGELWSEWIPDRARLEMLAVPRMQALAEVGWSPAEKRDFAGFLKRLETVKPTLRANGVNYAESGVALAEDAARSRTIVKKFRKGNPYLETEINKQLKGDNEDEIQ